MYSFTASNRYKTSSYTNKKSEVYCLVCGKAIDIESQKTMYIQTTTEHKHGNSFNSRFSINSYIHIGEDIYYLYLENLDYLYKIIEDEYIDMNIKIKAKDNIDKIFDNANNINLYNKDSVILKSLMNHKKIYNKYVLNEVERIEIIKSDIYKLSKGWELRSNIGLLFLDIYNWVVLEYRAVFKSEISPVVCGLEMYMIYYAWVKEGRNIRGKIQIFHDNYKNESLLIEDIFKEFKLRCNLNKEFDLKKSLINIFNYASKVYILDYNFKFGIINAINNTEDIKEFYYKFIKRY